MSRANIKVKGHVSRDPELRATRDGTPVLGLSVPHTPRRYDEAEKQWVDAGSTLWVQASIFGPDAELYAQLVRKGTLVVIEGEPTLREWSSGDKSGVNLEIRHPQVSLFPRRPRQEEPPAEEGWYTEPVPGEPGVPGDEVPF